MQSRMKLWIEKDGELVLAEWRVQLLETVDETGSLSEAATRLGVHYRIAWDKVRRMERRLGFKMLESHSGGVGGGGATLTEQARDLCRRYRQLKLHLDTEAAKRFSELFPDNL
jgi:molybdate transport system regulatory protein